MILAELRNLVERRTEELLRSKGKAHDVPSFDLSLPPPKIPGHLAANLPLMMAKVVGQSPRLFAEEIIRGFPDNSLVDKIEVAGPGFLNFWMRDDAFRSELEDLLFGKKNAPPARFAGRKVLIEFVSANPTGPLHVGHGRGAALGDSLSRIFRYLGCDVTAEFYVNDSGGQIRNLGLSVEARLKELKGQKVEFPADGYRGDYVVELAEEILEKKLELQPVKPDQILFTEKDFAGFAGRRILADIKKDLDNFGVRFDEWYAESTLHKNKKVDGLIVELRKRGLAFEKEGALWFKASDFGDEKDRVLKKTNEAPTYFASDVAYHHEKFRRGFGKLINVWGADHHGYAQRLKGAIKAIEQNPDDLEIVLNQMISIKGGRLSKRAGAVITLRELVEEVGRDATRFFFALRSPGAHFEFDLDLAKKKASDNPVYYVQYVHARCCSIRREASSRSLRTEPLSWKGKRYPAPLKPEERSILLHLMSFDRTVDLCARDYSNHHLTVYLIELAGKYHSFYETCRVLEDDAVIRSFRLDLIEAIRKRVEEGLNLLGVSAPEKL